jgi:leader peptidase (prepilin peptidase)/N-methyltransferase
MTGPVVVAVALLGALVGRCAALLVERVPLDDPALGRPLGCPACDATRPARSWVPVVGPLSARCGSCGASMPRGEALLDVTMALTFALLAHTLADEAVLVAYLLFATSVVTLAAIDLQTLRLPDRMTLPTFALGIPVLLAAGAAVDRVGAVQQALVGAGAYFGILLLAHVIYPRGMGFGDVKLALSMGLFLGWLAPGGLEAFRLVLYAMLMGFGLGTVAGVAVMVARRRSAPYPFGPFLVVGSLLGVLFAESIIR